MATQSEDLANPPYLERRLIEIAKTRLEEIADEDMTEEEIDVYIKNIIEKATVVFGVYPDKSSNEFGVHIIKGRREIGVFLASWGVAPYEDGTITAIPCTGVEQAMAAEDLLGDGLLKAN